MSSLAQKPTGQPVVVAVVGFATTIRIFRLIDEHLGVQREGGATHDFA
jgi:hypothetical protein